MSSSLGELLGKKVGSIVYVMLVQCVMSNKECLF